jgi:hypothetical protein
MAVVGFNKAGFKLMHQRDSYVYHIEDGSHTDLLNYINTDLSHLDEHIRQYVAKVIDIDTFELTSYKLKEEDTAGLLDIFKQLHPIYWYENRSALKREVCEYFNALLYERWRKSKIEYSEEWYTERYEILTAFDPTGTKMRFDDKYYRKYATAVGTDSKDDWESSVFPLNQDSETKTQDFVKKMLFYILNLSAPHIGALTIRQRIWLCNNILGEPIFSVPLRLSLEPQRRYGNDEEFNKQQKGFLENYDLFMNRGVLFDYHINHENATEAQDSQLRQYAAKAKALTDNWYYEEYEVTDTRQLLFLEIVQMIKRGTRLRYCKLCGRYFIPTHQRKLYCEGYAEGETQPCSKIGPKRNYENQPEVTLYSRAYNRHAARKKNGTISKGELNDWDYQAKLMRDKVKSGEIDIAEFENWLKEND